MYIMYEPFKFRTTKLSIVRQKFLGRIWDYQNSGISENSTDHGLEFSWKTEDSMISVEL